MKNQLVESSIQYHNNYQLDYFGYGIKETMVPKDSYYVLNHVKKMIHFSGINRQDNILEVGCGMGKFTIPLAKQGYKITGLDLSPFLLQKLLTYNDNRFDIPLIAGDILEAPLSLNESFDHIIGFFTLHHFHNLHVCYQAMARLLKPGGTITFIEPNAFNPLYYLQILFTKGMTWKGERGIALMKKSSISRSIKFNGLIDLRINKYGLFPPMVVKYKSAQYIERKVEKINFVNPLLPFCSFKVNKPKPQ